jgi:hypothetical protein
LAALAPRSVVQSFRSCSGGRQLLLLLLLL